MTNDLRADAKRILSETGRTGPWWDYAAEKLARDYLERYPDDEHEPITDADLHPFNDECRRSASGDFIKLVGDREAGYWLSGENIRIRLNGTKGQLRRLVKELEAG